MVLYGVTTVTLLRPAATANPKGSRRYLRTLAPFNLQLCVVSALRKEATADKES